MYHVEQSCLKDRKDTLKSQPLFLLARGIPRMSQGRIVRPEGLCLYPQPPATVFVCQEGKSAPQLPTCKLSCVSLSIVDGLITFSLNHMKLPFFVGQTSGISAVSYSLAYFERNPWPVFDFK